MSVKSRTCIWIECDNEACGPEKGWTDEGPFHFADEDAAIAYVLGENGMGWTRLPDERVLCDRCSRDVGCTVTGHQWTEWRHGFATTGQPDPSVEIRFCTHCGSGYEQRLTAVGGAITYPSTDGALEPGQVH